ncbi:LysR family transcriptional regulator [Rhodovibrio salinarum]|nr:LysR family transcriptional regulator [Rhodovibrio salinarum]
MRSDLIRDYEAFLCVAEAGSFVGGARALGVSASAMSAMIRRLEARVGVQLLHRTTRSVSLTNQGSALKSRLQGAFDEIDAATQHLLEHREAPSGTVRIVISRDAYDDVIAPCLADLHATFPQILLDIHLEEVCVDIVSERYDLGFRLGEYLHPDTVAVPVGPDLRHLAVASPGYAAAHGLPSHPRELTHHSCLNWRKQVDGEPYAWEFEKDGTPLSIAVQGPMIFNDRSAAVRAAMDGIGIAMWLEHRLRPMIDDGSLVPVLEEWAPSNRGVFAYYYRNRHMSPATRAVVQFLRRRAAGERWAKPARTAAE